MILALAVTVIATLGGAMTTYVFDRGSPGYVRLATGAYIGLTALAFVAFVLALFVGLGPVTVAIATAVTATPLLLLRRPAVAAAVRRDLTRTRRRLTVAVRRPTGSEIVAGAYGLAILAGAWLVADRTFFQTPEGMFIGNVNNLGDLPYHVQISASFAHGANFPPQNPVFAGSGFSYHYVADLLASVFVVAGASMIEAMLIMNVVLGVGLLVLIHRWTRDLTGSPVAARLAPLLLIFNGGLGFLNLFEEARASTDGLIGTYLSSAERYTMAYEGSLRFGNAVTALLIPQRALLLGMGVAVIVFGLLWHQLEARGARPADVRAPREWLRWAAGQPRMLVAGILTGLLPIVHVHTFAVVLGTAFLLGVVFRQWREIRWPAWAVYVVTTVVVAIPVFLLTARGSQANVASFIGLDFGWELTASGSDPLSFWILNTGLFIPLLVVAYLWRGERPLLTRKLALYSLVFVAWFVVANVLRLAPWMWDNIKVLIYWWLGAVPVVALLLARLWQERAAEKALAVALAVVLMLSGAMDVGRTIVGPTYREWDNDGIAFADQIREVAPPSAVVLTAPTFNTPVFLTGRPVFMGYTGYLFANGLPWGEREPLVRAVYAGEPGAEDIIRANGIEFIVVGPEERSEFSGVVPNDLFLSRFPVAAEVGPYRIYDVREVR